MNKFVEIPDTVDSLGSLYVWLLFGVGIVFSFMAVNTFRTDPGIFQISLIYAIMLLFGLVALIGDRLKIDLGFDTIVWNGENFRFKVLFAIGLIAFWWFFFMRAGLSVAVPQSFVTAFSAVPNYLFAIVGFFGPIVENIFFFGVMLPTSIMVFGRLTENRVISLLPLGGVLLLIPLYENIPFATTLLTVGAVGFLIASLSQNDALQKAAVYTLSVILIVTTFAKFHSFAYGLREASFVASMVFGFVASVVTLVVGLEDADALHVFNNVAVLLAR